MDFRLLGPLEVWEDGRPLSLGGMKQRALLAILLLRANEVVSRDVLIDELWGERPPASAAHSLEAYVSRLRKTLHADRAGEPILVTRQPGYMLRVGFEELDLHRFERLLEEGRRALATHAPERALPKLSDALTLWRGSPLGDLAFEPFAQVEVERLEELRLAALEERFEAELALGRTDALVPGLQALVAQHPLRERLRGQLMLALYRSGRQADALHVYREARGYLVEELGLEPGPSLKTIEQAILRQETVLDARERDAGGAAVVVVPPPPSPPPPEPGRPSGGRPPVRERLRRRRVALFALAGASVLAVALTVAVLSVVGGEERAGLASVSPGSVAVIDARTNVVLGGIPVGTSPSSIAVDEGAVWVLNGNDNTVSRIDPDLKKEVRRISVGGTPTDLAVGEGAVWVANGFDNTVTRIEPDSSLVVETIPLPTAGELPPVSLGSGAHLAIGHGAVWVTRLLQHGFVWQIDPKTNTVEATIRLPLGAGGQEIAVGEGAVWVNGNRGMTRIDETTHAITLLRAIEPGGIGGIAVGEGAVWVAGLSTGLDRAPLWRIDFRGESVIASTLVGAGPAGVAVGAGSIWVANSLDGSVSRVDPERNTVARAIPVGAAPRDVAVGEGAVWVTAG
jgi:YVTN family beta-propeller protein